MQPKLGQSADTGDNCNDWKHFGAKSVPFGFHQDLSFHSVLALPPKIPDKVNAVKLDLSLSPLPIQMSHNNIVTIPSASQPRTAPPASTFLT